MKQCSRLIVFVLALAGAIPAFAIGDYGFLWWPHGWRGASADGTRMLCVQTSRYGLAIDVNSLAIPHFGPIPDPAPYAEAVAGSNDVVFSLPPAALSLLVEADGARYRFIRAAEDTSDHAAYPVRLIESGQVAQRFDIQQLVFEREDGGALPATARLEVIAWPDELRVFLEITPEADLADSRIGIGFTQGAHRVEETAPRAHWKAGEPIRVSLALGADGAALAAPQPEPRITVADRRTGEAVPVTFDALRGWRYVDLPEAGWSLSEEPDRLDRFTVRIENPGDQPLRAPLNFAFDGAFTGVVGMIPMLRDAADHPTGIPVQVSKNWHSLPDRRLLYEGPWFHGLTMIEVAPGETWKGEMAIAYARWGGAPAVSHAQLSLVGWGTNQRWDQVAIGSWGETICYDPDVNLNRSIIDDVRPLMVTGMRGGPWQWTVNVGGGDFLVYFDAAGKKQYLSRMRAAYLEPGPNLTRTVYAGQTPGGEIEARFEVSSPRCDDVGRAWHTFRYDVKKPVAWSRLAFYQLGADHYNDHQFTMIARGNASELAEEWETPRGGEEYHRAAIPCEGAAPWFSLHGGERNANHPQGAWANRGLIIRAWKARLGGQDVPQPFAAVYGTENGLPSANVELVPPPGSTELLPGDFVEAEVELVVIPAEPGSYYGPNEAFKEHLEANIDTWKPVHRLAAMNNLRIDAAKGAVARNYPAEIATDSNGEAEITIHGGAGYVPVTFTGLPERAGYVIEGAGEDADLFVQVAYEGASKTWSRTYNVNMDGVEKRGLTLRRVGGE
ncbi:MAG: hypothetical protein KF886_12940 [Candidatus Hydrogenedentes bacterium]|nr:hypothetical protein [Candidatus Hydrogenedentota bacterium]